MFENLGIESLADLPVMLPTTSSDWEKGVPYLTHGVRVSIEYLAGDVRRKTRRDGSVVENLFLSAYGEIIGITDRTGERPDVYLAEPFTPDAKVYIIDQVDDRDRVFDEHKIFFGFMSKEQVLATYEAVFTDAKGLLRIGTLVEMTPEQFDEWRSENNSFMIPASFSKIAGIEIYPGATPIKMPLAPPCEQTKPKTFVKDGAVQVVLKKAAEGITVVSKPKGETAMSYQVYVYGHILEHLFLDSSFQLIRLLEDASEDDEFIIHISTPGGDVITGGTLVSAMRSTLANVTTIAEGPVCSCGVTLWSEGKTRIIEPGAVFMQHMTNGGMSGSTGTLAEKLTFTRDYVLSYMSRLVHIGLFTQEEINDMVEREAEIFIDGDEAIRRVGGAVTHD